MSSSAQKMHLTSLDELFGIEKPPVEVTKDSIQNIELSQLHPFPDHPFQVNDDEHMMETVESIKEYGVLVPIIVRPREEGGFEIISGHRRKRACELAGIESIPAVVREIDRDAATIYMVDSNLQRENILPSERAKAYKMKLDAIKRQAGRPAKDNSVQLGQNFEGKTSREIVADKSNDSSTQIQRYIRLTELEPELMQMVDDKKIGFTPAVELSFLDKDEQALLIETIASEQATPSLSQAQRLKKFSQEGRLDEDVMLAIMSEEKKPEMTKLTLSGSTLSRYFPRSYTPRQMEETIIRLLEQWQRHRDEPER